MPTPDSVRATSLLLVLGLGIAGCPDPTAGTTGQGPGAGPAGGPPGAGGPGGPPPAGAEGGAPPMAGAAAGSGRPDGARFNLTEGEGVTLSGTFEYAGTKTGQLRVDFLTREENGPPMLAHALSLEDKGEWKVEAPENFGEVYLVAFIDQKGDGPSADDPAGRVADAVKIGTEDVAGIKLVLTDDADLGDLAPGAGAPPPGSGEAGAAISPEAGGQPGTQDGVDPSAQGATPTAGGALPTGEGAALPTGEAAPMPAGEGGATPMPAGQAAPMPTGEAAPMPSGEAAPMPSGG